MEYFYYLKFKHKNTTNDKNSLKSMPKIDQVDLDEQYF